MTYLLSPFTDLVLRLFGIGPFWILYLGTVLGMTGLVLELSDKTELLGVVAGMLRTFTDKAGPVTVKINPSISSKIGLALLIIGVLLGAAGTDAVAGTPAVYNYLGYGGPSLYHCSDLPTVVSWIPGLCSNFSNSNATACLSTAPSPCWTKVQHGFGSCVLASGGCTSATITFSPSYSVKPFIFIQTNSTSTGRGTGTITTSLGNEYLNFFTGEPGTGIGTTWTGMPAAQTELFGGTDLRTNFNFVSAFYTNNAVTDFCVNLVTASFGAGAYLSPFYSTNGGATWTEWSTSMRVTIDGSIGTGLICQGTNIAPLSTGNYIVAVFGVNGLGAGDAPAFGSIFMEINGPSSSAGYTTSCGYFAVVFTAVSFKVSVNCVGGTSTQNYQWWAGIPA